MPAIPEQLAGRHGWTVEAISCMEAYQGMDVRYYLPTLAEFRASLSPQLDEVECVWGHYELADRCPTLVFARD